MTPFFLPPEPAAEASCDVRTVAARHGTPFRASLQAGTASIADRPLRFAANAGVGLDLVNVDRACRPSSGFLPDAPHLRTTIGAWFDTTLMADAHAVFRPALHVTFGSHDAGWLKLPVMEGYAMIGAARSDRFGPSGSIGFRLVFLEAELRADLVRPGATWMAFLGLHLDASAW